MPSQADSRTASEALDTAHTLAGAGRYLDGIDVLTAANRRRRSIDLDRRLVDLRHEAFGEVEQAQRLAPCPPPLPDPFPQRDDLVEVDARELSSELIGGAILHHGCALVRGLIPREVAASLVETTDLAFEAQEGWRRQVESDPAGNAASSPWFEPFAPNPRYALDPFHLPLTRMNRESYRVLLADSPPAMFDVLEAFAHAGLHRILGGYLGVRPVMTVSRSVLRRLPQKPRTLGWHQDAAVFGRPAPSVNCWIALTDCGDDAPGLEVVPRRVSGVVDTPANRGLSRSNLSMTRSPRLQGVVPIFAPGDALLFDDLLIHRTAVTEHMTKPRYSIENWFFTAQSLPSNNAPIVF